MDWKTARNETLDLWRNIRLMIDRPDELDLLTEINAACALCDVANEQEPQTLTRCERCLAFQQFGGCSGVNLEMSQRVVEKEWDALRELVDAFIDHLSRLEMPSEASPARPS